MQVERWSGPGRRTPSRASAPGTESRYQAKSSPPMLCAVSATASGPSADRGRALHGDRGRVVDDRRHAAGVVDLGAGAPVGATSLLDQLRHQRLGARPRRRGRSTRSVPRSRRLASGSRWPPGPASTAAPHQRQRGARVDPARQQRRQLGDDHAERVDEVDGQVRAAVWPPGPVQRDVDLVAGRGDRRRSAARSGRSPGAGRSAARRSARRRRARRPRPPRARRRAAVSSAGWKISRTRPGRSRRPAVRSPRPAGSRCARRGRRRGRRPSTLRAVRHVLRVGDRQRVDVGPQRDDRAGPRADVAHDAGSARQGLRGQPQRAQVLQDERGGAESPRTPARGGHAGRGASTRRRRASAFFAGYLQRVRTGERDSVVSGVPGSLVGDMSPAPEGVP